MNIFESYEEYRKQHAMEFRELLKNVEKQVLCATDSIPKDFVFEYFQTCAERRYLNCDICRDTSNGKEEYLHFDFGDEVDIGFFPYDTSAAEELDKFIEKYYPGINCSHSYTLDLYDRTVEFTFYFDVSYDVEDFIVSEYNDIAYLKSTKRCIADVIRLFNDDISEILHHKFSEEDWEELCVFKFKKGEREIETHSYFQGHVYVRLSLSNE